MGQAAVFRCAGRRRGPEPRVTQGPLYTEEAYRDRQRGELKADAAAGVRNRASNRMPNRNPSPRPESATRHRNRMPNRGPSPHPSSAHLCICPTPVCFAACWTHQDKSRTGRTLKSGPSKGLRNRLPYSAEAAEALIEKGRLSGAVPRRVSGSDCMSKCSVAPSSRSE